MFQVAKLYMVSWSRAEDSEEARHVIDNTGKVNVEIKKIISFLQARDISDVLAELREELGQEVESKQAWLEILRLSRSSVCVGLADWQALTSFCQKRQRLKTQPIRTPLPCLGNRSVCTVPQKSLKTDPFREA